MDAAMLGFTQGYIRKQASGRWPAGSATEALIRAVAPGIHLEPGEMQQMRFKNDNLGLTVEAAELPGMVFGQSGLAEPPTNIHLAKLAESSLEKAAETSEDKDNEEGGDEIPRDRKADILVQLQEQKQEQKEAKAKKKSKKDAKVGKVMGEFKRGELRSGSKDGPKVENRDQAIAIAMSEAEKEASARVQVVKRHIQKSAALSALARTKVPKKEFGVPAKAEGADEKKQSGNYPMPDKAHARSALRLLHNASPEEQKQIRAKAHRILGTGEE